MTTPAAVLVPLINRPDGLTVLFTERSADLPDHPGQISFPGGRIEPEDADAVAAALREAEEEIALPRDRVQPLGRLADYETVTGYRVTPIVGWVEPPIVLKPDPSKLPRSRGAADVSSRARQSKTSFPHAGRAAPRLPRDSVRRALHLGRDRGDAADSRSYAARGVASLATFGGRGSVPGSSPGGGARAAYQAARCEPSHRILRPAAAGPFESSAGPRRSRSTPQRWPSMPTGSATASRAWCACGATSMSATSTRPTSRPYRRTACAGWHPC